MSEAIYIVHWPGKDTAACEEHAQKLTALGRHMGISVSSSVCITNEACANCENEEKRAQSAAQAGEPNSK